MISFSSSNSNNNLNNNNLERRRYSNFNFRSSRCLLSKVITNQNEFNIPTILNNLKNIKNEITDENTHTQEDSLGLINKLKNLKVSLENEKSFSNLLNNIILLQKNKNKNNYNLMQSQKNNENIHSRNKNNPNNKGTLNSHDMNTASTKSTGSNIFYPDVFYINQDNNLHKKTHFSTIFQKLKKGKK